MGSRKTGAPARGETSPAKAHPLWRELNYRQRAYREAVYRADQDAEAWERSAWSRGWERRPADQWRWLVYHSEFSKIRERLLRQGMVDEGTGSTFAALAGRGSSLPATGRNEHRWGSSRSSTSG